MKNKIQKFLSVLIILLLFWTNTSFAIIGKASSNTKSQKLAKLNIKLNDYIDKEIKKSISLIKNDKDKVSFENELEIINEIGKDLNINLKYSNDANYDENFIKLRNQARSFIHLKKDIATLTNSWINVYSIIWEEKTNIEKNIVGIQKYYIDIIKDELKNFDWESDIKETWDGKFEIISNVWKISFTVNKYVNILSYLKWSQDFDLDISIWVDIKKNEKLNIPFDIIWNANFKVNVKTIEKDIYITLSDYSINFDWIKDMVKPYNEIISPYKWKTIHIENSYLNSTNFNLNTQLNNFKKILDILSSYSILTPLKKKQNDYILIPNIDTFNKISWVLWEKISQNDTIVIRKAFNSSPIIYSENWWIISITSEIKDKWFSSKLAIWKKWEDYSIEYSLNWIKNWQKIDLYLFLQKNLYKLNLTSQEFTIKFNLENKIFDLLLTYDDNILSIKWTSDNDNNDLKILFNNKEIWNIKTSKDSNSNYTYNFWLKISDFSEFWSTIPTEFKDLFIEINLN